MKTLDVPSEWASRRIFLRIGAAGSQARVFVNGRLACSHSGGSTAFSTELTSFLSFGAPNTLLICVNNSPSSDVLPLASEENPYGGLYRGVDLIVCDPLSVSPAASGSDAIAISTSHLDSELASGTVSLSLLDTLSSASARIRIFDAERNVVSQGSAPASSTEIEIPFSIPSPRFWNGTADPYLYRVEVTLSSPENNTTTDSLSIPYGFRSLAVDSSNRLSLNGVPLRIRGVILHRDRAMTGPALSPFQIEEDVALIRELGANAVRVFGGRHSDSFYTLCDSLGLLVWTDIPLSGTPYPTDIDFSSSPSLASNAHTQLTETISQLRLHPSAAIWGIFSNLSLRWDDPLPLIRSLNASAHSLDPRSLTAGSSTSDGDINFISDLVSFEVPFGWRSGMPDGITVWLSRLRSGWPGLHAGISFGSGGSIFHQSPTLQRPDPDGAIHPEGWQTFFHREYLRLAVDSPSLWGVFVANMFDFGNFRAPGGVDDRGLVTFDRKYFKESFFLYREAWSGVPYDRRDSSRGRTTSF